LNRYPQLKSVFNNYINQGYFENVQLEYVPGVNPTIYFYDDHQVEVGSVQLGDVDLEGLKQILSQHGFELRRPKLPDPILKSELTEGGVHYQFYDPGKMYHNFAEEFASFLTHNGQKGRLLTLRCRDQEEKIDAWLKQFNHDSLVIWLGASDKESEGYWKWSNGDVFWIQNADSNTAYANWRAGEPNNADGNEHCATYLPEKGWNDVNCESAAQIVVEFGPSSNFCTNTESVVQHVQSVTHDEVNL